MKEDNVKGVTLPRYVVLYEVNAEFYVVAAVNKREGEERVREATLHGDSATLMRWNQGFFSWKQIG